MVQGWILLGTMLIISREDIRTGQISGEWLVFLALLSVGIGITDPGMDYLGLAAFLPGLLLCLLSQVSRGRIGMGDAYLFWALGFCLRPLMVFRILMDSFTLAGVYALGICIRCRVQRQTEEIRQEGFPMVPLVTVAAAGVWGGGL